MKIVIKDHSEYHNEHMFVGIEIVSRLIIARVIENRNWCQTSIRAMHDAGNNVQ